MKDVINRIRDRFVNYRKHYEIIDYLIDEIVGENFNDNQIATDKIADNSVTRAKIEPNSIVTCSKCGFFASPNSECVICGHVNERCN